MVPGDLLDPATTQSVEACVADVSDRRNSLLDDRDGEDARHPVPFRARRGQAIDLVVGNRDRLSHALGDRPRLAFKPFSQHRKGDIGRLPAGRLPADTVDHDEQATPPRRCGIDPR